MKLRPQEASAVRSKDLAGSSSDSTATGPGRHSPTSEARHGQGGSTRAAALSPGSASGRPAPSTTAWGASFSVFNCCPSKG